jgi:peptidyl-prolyl cis-trans isomerase SurA
MKIKSLFLALFIAVNFVAVAQKTTKDVLFTINEKPYYTDEFKRVYNKNIDLVKDESQKDLNQYLDLFVGYKLKVNKANDLGLNKVDKYANELKGYRTQLAKNYFTDSKVTQALVNEGYERMKKEVRASHILFTCDENAAPTDTLIAYNKAKEVRERTVNGEDFGKLAQEFSQDPSAKDNKGDLGYFSAFRMVYPFENAAFKTPKGQISQPIRSRFGYHIIKVVDNRDNRGEISVEHIMVMKPANDSIKSVEKAEKTIRDIYKKFQQGENFEELAKLYSEDKASAPKGGLMNRFGSGQLSSNEFEDTAFGLTKENPVSAPIKSAYGWHIVKLIEKFPVKSLADLKTELEEKISKDERSRLVTASLNEKLRKKYTVKKDIKLYEKVQKTVNDTFYDSKWEVPSNSKDYTGNLVSVQEANNSGETFLNYIKDQQKSGIKLKPVNKLVDKLYKSFEDEKINNYYNDNLEKEFPEFSYVMDEYRDGLLLFDLMEKEIWEKSKTDTIGLKKYFDLNKSKYLWKTRLEMTVASSTKEDVVKEALKMLKAKATSDEIKTKLNTKDVVNVMTTKGVFEEGNNAIPKGTKLEIGVSEITKSGEYYFVSLVDKVLPAGSKTFEECKGKLINDYQQNLEANWVDNLKAEYKVKINQDVFEKVKKEITQKK